MLLLVLLIGVPAVVGTRAAIGNVRATAETLARETLTVSSLKSAVLKHEQVGHQLLSSWPVDKATYVAAQNSIAEQFRLAIPTFQTSYGLRATMVKAAASWEQALRDYGLWSTQLNLLHGDPLATDVAYGAASDTTTELLDGLNQPILARTEAQLTSEHRLETALTTVMITLFGAALLATIYFRKRMVSDIVVPISVMQDGVARLRAGDYLHRLPTGRNDELGELSAAFNDMCSDLHVAHLELTMRAAHDSLTGLTNRASLNDRLEATFGPGTERRARKETLLFIDIDDFKDINDNAGHEGGDGVLIELAQRLRASVRPYDVVARLGGDEFAIMVIEDESASAGVTVARRVVAAMQEPVILGSVARHVSVSIGIAQRSVNTRDAAHFLRNADAAMYLAKQAGKNTYRVFSDTGNRLIDR